MTRPNRRQQILQAFALMLETRPGTRITTAALAQAVGVSEAALYRHYPSKAKMIEGLIEFMEASVFTRVNRIMAEEETALSRCRSILWLILSFAERNPGFSRLFVGDALLGESDRLRHRMRQFFDRLETQFRQIIREAHARRLEPSPISAKAAANLLLATAEGRINQFVRSEFKSMPTTDWDEQWTLLERSLFS
jgi:TetR/AcrR family transcriptional regulator